VIRKAQEALEPINAGEKRAPLGRRHALKERPLAPERQRHELPVHAPPGSCQAQLHLAPVARAMAWRGARVTYRQVRARIAAINAYLQEHISGIATVQLFNREQQEAAKRLRVHPNTLRYRLDRIREISGVDLEDPETRLNMAVALRVQALLGM